MKLLLDMNLSPDWVKVLAPHGFEALHWSTVGDPRATDRQILEWARTEKRVLFTHDLDFGRLLALTRAVGPSVLQVRAQDVLPAKLSSLVIETLRGHQSQLEAGALIVIDERSARAGSCHCGKGGEAASRRSQFHAESWPGPTMSELTLPTGLETPRAIQTFLDSIAYSADPIYRCPRRVIEDGKAHCFDGALFGAAALRRLGYPPLILEMLAEPTRDDSHLLALFKEDGGWGAVAKSNFVGLRFREPIHRTLRELVVSYFEDFYNDAREKTLRGYTRPLSLRPFDRLGWETNDEPLDAIADRLDAIGRVSLLTPRQVARLSPLDERAHQAGMLGLDRAGLSKVPAKET